MVSFFINMVLIVSGFAIIKYREAIGNMIGDHYWMRYVGGVYGFTVIIGIGMFFYGVARLTGTTDILLAPVIGILPDSGTAPAAPGGF